MINDENAVSCSEVRAGRARRSPTGELSVHLGERYGDPDQPRPADHADRVILVTRVVHGTTR